jgi:flagellar biosynthesis protein FlhF
MQVKKYEAPTLQEALDTIKRELGPEAIILQTKQNRRGFGLMSKGSVEVTAAVSERSTEKKKTIEKRLPDAYNKKINTLPAKTQADIYESYLEKRLERENQRDQVQLSNKSNETTKKITAVRYADIQDDASQRVSHSQPEPTQNRINRISDEPAVPEYQVPSQVASAIDQYQDSQTQHLDSLQNEVAQLKRLVEELRKERKKPEYLDSDSPLSATDALQEAFELLLQSGIDRRMAIQMMRDIGRDLSLEARADRDTVLDAVAESILKRSSVKNILSDVNNSASAEVHAFVGPAGSGKTSTLAKIVTDAVRNRNEKIGIVRIQLLGEESADPLVVFAKALHIPYRSVTSVDELQVAIQDMSGCHRIFVDCPGVSAKDPNALNRIKTLIQSAPQVKVHAVLSSITRDLELQEQTRMLQTFNPQSLIFTRLDESYAPGIVLSVSNRMKIPVSVFSSGRKVTEAWETATPERIAASILNINC